MYNVCTSACHHSWCLAHQCSTSIIPSQKELWPSSSSLELMEESALSAAKIPSPVKVSKKWVLGCQVCRTRALRQTNGRVSENKMHSSLLHLHPLPPLLVFAALAVCMIIYMPSTRFKHRYTCTFFKENLNIPVFFSWGTKSMHITDEGSPNRNFDYPQYLPPSLVILLPEEANTVPTIALYCPIRNSTFSTIFSSVRSYMMLHLVCSINLKWALERANIWLPEYTKLYTTTWRGQNRTYNIFLLPSQK